MDYIKEWKNMDYIKERKNTRPASVFKHFTPFLLGLFSQTSCAALVTVLIRLLEGVDVGAGRLRNGEEMCRHL
jgi:hypothetical protein